MQMVLHKSKQYWLVALKVLVLTVTFGYIYHKISSEETIQWSGFVLEIKTKGFSYLVFFILLAVVNWVFEILKWQTVVSKVKNISFAEATKQSLTALTVSLPTPNRVGDYGAKSFFYASEKRKEIVFLNFLSNSLQMVVTCVFGGIGLFFFLQNYSLPISSLHVILFFTLILLVGIFGYFFRRKQFLIKGLSILKMVGYVTNLQASIKLKLFLFSTIRYVVFSFLFFQLLLFFDAEISFLEALPLIFMMYFLVSIVPSFLLFDVVIRGGIAVWLFSLVGVAELKVLLAVFLMWGLNFIIPALIGSWYVITYKHSAL